MTNIAEIERQLSELSPSEREQLALKAWESLTNDPDASADPRIDPEGIEVARARDGELDRRRVSTLSQHEFRSQTGGRE